MKIIIAFLLLTPIIGTYGQTETLYANQTHNLALFFPSPIRQATPGSKNFTFSYNRDAPQHFGLLQGSPGVNSNLLVVTNDGQVYSFALQYREKLPQTNKYIKIDASIGRERQIEKIIKPELKQDSIKPKTLNKGSNQRKAEYFKNLCSSFILKKPKNLKSKRKDGMTLKLQDMVYHHRQVYLVFNIINKSGIDFELEYLNVFKVNGNNRRKSSFQRRQLIPVYAHNFPSMINDESNTRFVYVVPKFTLGDSEKLLFELNEKRGSRIIHLVMKKVGF